MPTSIQAVFLDDGGVLNDNERRAPEWQRLVGAYLAPRLGGTPDAWGAANRAVFPRLWPMVLAGPRRGQGVRVWWEDYQRLWLRGMAEDAGLDAPSQDTACLRMAEDAIQFVTRRVVADVPGAVETVRHLDEQGFLLFTASGTVSWELAGYLDRMGIHDRFRKLYGPDLIDHAKIGVAYYERIFADAGVEPSTALVLDDAARHLAWAHAAGARTCLVGPAAPGAYTPNLHIDSIAALPKVLRHA